MLTLSYILFLSYPLLLLAAAAYDGLSYRIPNYLNLALGAMFFPFALAVDIPSVLVGWHILVAACTLGIGFVLFSCRMIGGGDAKLLASCALWMGTQDIIALVVMMSFFGGLLCISILIARRLSALAMFTNWGLFKNLATTKLSQVKIPYGIAVAAGGLYILPETMIFSLAIGI